MANDLVVLIPTAGQRPDLLRRTLSSLAGCSKPSIYRRTLVIENGSKGATEQIVAEFRSLNAGYVHVSTRNKSRALNTALELLEDCLVYFADDDIRLHPETLKAYAAASEGASNGRFYGGPCGVDYEQAPPDWLTEYLPGSARGWHWESADQIVMKPAFLGFNWAAFSTDLRQAGGFDEDQGPGLGTATTVGDEREMQERLLMLGCTGQYVSDAPVWHYVPAERSTPEWAVRRKYQHGVAHGITASRLGMPRSYWYYLMRCWLIGPANLLISKLRRDSQRRFRAQFWYSRDCGFLAGIQQGRRVPHRTEKRRELKERS